MNTNYLDNSRILIIEGIAGTGKDTFQKMLEKNYIEKGFLVYSFSEEELLFSWKHSWIKGIELPKIIYWNLLLEYFKEILKNPNNLIILNRFHITYAIYSEYNEKAKGYYDKLIQELKKLPVKIFLGKLEEYEIKKRSSHIERKEEIFRIHQQKRLKLSGCNSLKEMYLKEQELYFKIIKKQEIPYKIIKI